MQLAFITVKHAGIEETADIRHCRPVKCIFASASLNVVDQSVSLVQRFNGRAVEMR